jgi:hypothetical protein
MDKALWEALSGLFTKKTIVIVSLVGAAGTAGTIAIHNSVSSTGEERPASSEAVFDLDNITATYKVIFPYIAPRSDDERHARERFSGDDIAYMNYLRGKRDIRLTRALAEAISDPTNLSGLEKLTQNFTSQGGLLPYVPLEDMPMYQQSRMHYQGTHVPARPSFWQQTGTGKLIPLTTAATKADDTKEVEPEKGFIQGRKRKAFIFVSQDQESFPWTNDLKNGYLKEGCSVGYWTYSRGDKNPSAELDGFIAEHAKGPSGPPRKFCLVVYQTGQDQFGVGYLLSNKHVRRLFIVQKDEQGSITAYPGRSNTPLIYNGTRIYIRTYRFSEMGRGLDQWSGLWVKEISQ